MKIFSLSSKETNDTLIDKILVCTTDEERSLIEDGNMEKLLENTPYSQDEIFLYADTEDVLYNGTLDNIALGGVRFNDYERELIFEMEDEMER